MAAVQKRSLLALIGLAMISKAYECGFRANAR